MMFEFLNSLGMLSILIMLIGILFNIDLLVVVGSLLVLITLILITIKQKNY